MRDIDFIEACYQLQCNRSEWATSLIRHANRIFGRQFRGIGGYSYELDSAERIHVPEVYCPPNNTISLDPDTGCRPFMDFINRSPIRAHVVASVFATYSERAFPLSEGPTEWSLPLRRRLPPGARDSICLHGALSLSEGFHMCLLAGDEFVLHPRRRRHLDSLAAHLAAGYRVQRTIGRLATADEDVLAVASPSGRLLHARPQFRNQETTRRFLSSVQRMDAVRCRRVGRGPEESGAMWSAFVDGHYSLVESFDSDGRRTILAVKTRLNPASRLTARERQVAELVSQGIGNKDVGARLGISPTTVAVHLHAVMRKLGLPDRRALVVWVETTTAAVPG